MFFKHPHSFINAILNTKKPINWGKSFYLLALLLVPLLGHSQEECVSTGDHTLSPSGDGWIGHVYQFPVDTLKYPDVNTFPAGGVYKGMLLPGYLPSGDINFDTYFGGNSNNENHNFDDNRWVNLTDTSCTTRLSFFGVVFKGKYTLPETGTYEITIASDDGARLKVDGSVIHNFWGNSKFSEANTRRYYIYNTAGHTLDIELLYYEFTQYNRVKFQVVRHYDGGLISGSQRISGINPDPVIFESLAPADFKVGSPQYQWQRSPNGFNTWTDVAGATGEELDIAAQLEGGPYVGITYFRRKATNGVEIYYSRNTVKLEICVVRQIDDHNIYGDKEWIGYVYKGKANFNEENFSGRIKQNAEFIQQFPRPSDGALLPQVWYPTLAEDGGCSFYTEEFTIRFMMEIWVDAGDYNFEVEGDDGFRLSIQDQDGNYLGVTAPNTFAINDWNDGRGRIKEITNYIAIEEPTILRFVLEYYDNINNNIITFKPNMSPFSILPLEWGKVSAVACGPTNCLTWETLQEKNTSHFELERSYNGSDWELFDHSVQAQGYSTEKVTYQFTDTRFMDSKVYYRIRQVDLDGAFAYSDVMRVDNPFYVKSYLPFPNPTMDKIRFFSGREVVGVSLVSNDYLLNKDLKPEKLLDNRYELDLVGLKPGNYVIVVQTLDGENDVFKVIKK